ncbi:MAG: DNA polymerase III subunit delta, partial [Pseudomonadota bacterium]
ELPKTSKLRKLFDAARHAITLPCYEDKPQDLAALATEMAAAFHLSFEPEALDYAVSLLGTDRGISRSELEKLILFAMPTDDSQRPKSISVNDVKECLVDAETSAFYEAAKSAIDGDAKGLSLSLRKSIAAGGSEVGFLRALQREVSRLLIVQTAVSSGLSSKDAMAQLRPPVFYGEQRAFSRRLQKWSRQKLAQANARLLAIEVDAKTTGAPSRTLIERASFAITSLANK